MPIAPCQGGWRTRRLDDVPAAGSSPYDACCVWPETVSAAATQLVTALATPWNRSLFELDPAPPLKGLDVPVLALYGDRDRQAPPVQHVPVLEGHWAGHPDATVRVLPGLNHFFQHAETGLPTEITQIDETLAPSALDAIADWIATRFLRG